MELNPEPKHGTSRTGTPVTPRILYNTRQTTLQKLSHWRQGRHCHSKSKQRFCWVLVESGSEWSIRFRLTQLFKAGGNLTFLWLEVKCQKKLIIGQEGPKDVFDKWKKKNKTERWGNKRYVIIICSSFLLEKSHLNCCTACTWVLRGRKHLIIPKLSCVIFPTKGGFSFFFLEGGSSFLSLLFLKEIYSDSLSIGFSWYIYIFNFSPSQGK